MERRVLEAAILISNNERGIREERKMMPYSHSVIDFSRKSQGITGDFSRTVLIVVQGPGFLIVFSVILPVFV